MKSRFTGIFRILCLLILAAFLTPLTLPALAWEWPPALADFNLFDASTLSILLALKEKYGEMDLDKLAGLAKQAGFPEAAEMAQRLKDAGFTNFSSIIAFLGGEPSESKELPDASGLPPNYQDASLIQYAEAVDVISSIGVLNGYSDGAFRPGDGLTRGAAAKIVARMIAPSDADNYPDTQRFSDVDPDHKFVRYVNYCYDQNLISGYADGKFRPQDPLTYAAFLKMTLCALGHRQDTEGYTGSGWQENVKKDARNAGLLTGLRSAFNVGDAICREVAALFALNLLQANKVDSSNGLAIPHATDSSNSVYKNIRDVSDDDGNQIVQFGEERFPRLSRVSSSGKVTWTLKDENGNSVAIGVYNDVSELVARTVRFDVNYDNLGVISTKTVYNGCIYGELPALSRDDRAFLGWSTSSGDSGDEITRHSPVWLSSDITLYAQWGAGTYTATFRVDGERYGKRVLIPEGNDLTGSQLPPEPTKPGRTFAYWRNADTGERLSPPVTVRSDLTFDAVFDEITRYRVEYHAGGSVRDPDAAEVASGATLQALPVLRDAANRRTFKGWKLRDGSVVKVPLTVTENLDLYARWVDLPSYHFSNSYEGFGYGADYFTPRERYQAMYGDNILAKALYEFDWNQSHATWQGNCYGMITTIGMLLKSGNDILIAHFRSSASSPWDLQLSDENPVMNVTLVEFIETMQIAQKTPSFVRAYWENINSCTGLCEAVSRFEETGEDPVVICIWGGPENAAQGHALLGYCLDDYSSSESRLYVYDPNHPEDAARYITMRKNSNGGYSGWEYNFKQNETWGSAYPGSSITYIPYDNYWASWNNRGSVDNAMQNLNTGIRNIAIYDENDRQVASFTNGVLDDVETAVRNGVYPIVPIGGGDSADDGISVWVPAGRGYWVENREASSAERITLTNTERSLTLNTSAIDTYLCMDGNRVVIYPVDDLDASYDIKADEEEDIPSEFRLNGREYAAWGQMVGSGEDTERTLPSYAEILPTRGTTNMDGEEIPTVRGRTFGGRITIDLSTGSVQRDDSTGAAQRGE